MSDSEAGHKVHSGLLPCRQEGGDSGEPSVFEGAQGIGFTASPVRIHAVVVSSASAMVMWALLMHVHITGKRIGYVKDGNSVAQLTAAASFLYVGRTCGSMLHMFFLGALQPRGRALLGYLCCITALLLIIASYYVTETPWTTSLVPFVIAYAVDGTATGAAVATALSLTLSGFLALIISGARSLFS